MGEKTGIRWCDATENPIRVLKEGSTPENPKFGGFYCIKVSPGCQNCYSEREAKRGRFGPPIEFKAMKNPPRLYLDEELLAGWSKKAKPKMRFVSSTTDICGEFLPDEWYYKILDAELAAPKQTFLNLTKRAQRMMLFTFDWMDRQGLTKAPENMWMGFSAESQDWFEPRWAWMRRLAEEFGFLVWVSVEPMLAGIALPDTFLSLGNKVWVVGGGESGANARHTNLRDVRYLRDQCVEAGVPFFWKQWGEWMPYEWEEEYTWRSQHGDVQSQDNLFNDEKFELLDNKLGWRWVGKHNAGYLLDGEEWSQWPMR